MLHSHGPGSHRGAVQQVPSLRQRALPRAGHRAGGLRGDAAPLGAAQARGRSAVHPTVFETFPLRDRWSPGEVVCIKLSDDKTKESLKETLQCITEILLKWSLEEAQLAQPPCAIGLHTEGNAATTSLAQRTAGSYARALTRAAAADTHAGSMAPSCRQPRSPRSC